MTINVGTLNWLDRTQGKIGFRDQLSQIASGVLAQAQAFKRAAARTRVRNLEVDEILPPDSPMALAALELSRKASLPFLLNHCLRAYFWARLMTPQKTQFDDEAVFSALMLHDLGLCEGHRLQPSDSQNCFTAVGAGQILALAKEHGWSDQRARLAAQAVSLHLNVVVDAAHGPEAQLVRLGSGADAAGLGIGILQKDQIAAVVARYPRLDFKEQIIRALDVEARERPSCRTAFLQKKLHFSQMVRASRFTE